ncbi:DUF1885 family protein [Salinithrix halophila]|uniref:DUF1885 family protein n=1 Tax=Salinithrix halophila TaxID=1485204 RepID=A0ABV8JDV8_9BACL
MEEVGKSAYIKLVQGPSLQELTLEDVKKELDRYIGMTALTGEQLGWQYANAAFPYTVEERSEGEIRYLLLKGKDPHLYKHLILGVGSEALPAGGERPFIQLALPDDATHGDTAKANEFSRYLARTFQAELHMLNGRVMHFNPRKP